MKEYSVDVVLEILRQIKEVLPVKESYKSEFICDHLHEIADNHYPKHLAEEYAIADRIEREIGKSFSYTGWYMRQTGEVLTFAQGQRKRQEFLDKMIVEFEAEKDTA